MDCTTVQFRANNEAINSKQRAAVQLWLAISYIPVAYKMTCSTLMSSIGSVVLE